MREIQESESANGIQYGFDFFLKKDERMELDDSDKQRRKKATFDDIA